MSYKQVAEVILWNAFTEEIEKLAEKEKNQPGAGSYAASGAIGGGIGGGIGAGAAKMLYKRDIAKAEKGIADAKKMLADTPDHPKAKKVMNFESSIDPLGDVAINTERAKIRNAKAKLPAMISSMEEAVGKLKANTPKIRRGIAGGAVAGTGLGLAAAGIGALKARRDRKKTASAKQVYTSAAKPWKKTLSADQVRNLQRLSKSAPKGPTKTTQGLVERMKKKLLG